jgi:hypothetical protein
LIVALLNAAHHVGLHLLVQMLVQLLQLLGSDALHDCDLVVTCALAKHACELVEVAALQ